MSVPETTTRDALATVLGRIPSGLFILTARNEQGQETGMLASWVQQAAFDPPAITVAVNRKRYLAEWLVPGSRVAVSVVGETQKNLLSHFGKGFDPGEPAFTGLATEPSRSGLTVLSDSLGWLDGMVQGSLAAGDHTIVLVQLTAASASPRTATEKPWVHLRKNGLGY